MTDLKVLADRYEVLDFLGEGGMARVFRGRDRILERTVAIKLLSDRLATDERSVERFRREARAAAGLSHPGIVAVYDTGTDDGFHFIVMEYVEGETLDRILRREGRLPPGRALEFAERVSEALAAAHASGIIHRDVKPANIMLAADGSVKVMDFGIVRAVQSDTLTHTATILGTASYLSPEQARGDPVDGRADLYSLGVVLYEMLTGRPPFVGENPVAVAAQHVGSQPLPPSQVEPSLGSAFDGVVLKALEKSPDDRYRSAEEFAEALGGLQAGTVPLVSGPPPAAATEVLPVDRTERLGAVGRQVPPPGHSVRPDRRFPVAAALAAFLVLAVLVALLLVGLTTGQDRGSPGGVRPTGRQSSRPATTQPSTVQSLTVGQAAAALANEIAQGVQAGDISQDAGSEIAKDGAKAVREFQHGHTDTALEGLSELDQTVDDLAAEGEITSDARVQALHSEIADLRAAIEAA